MYKTTSIPAQSLRVGDLIRFDHLNRHAYTPRVESIIAVVEGTQPALYARDTVYLTLIPMNHTDSDISDMPESLRLPLDSVVDLIGTMDIEATYHIPEQPEQPEQIEQPAPWDHANTDKDGLFFKTTFPEPADSQF